MPDRETLAENFVRSTGWADAGRTHVAGDASNRRYERLRLNDGRTAILMDAPPERGEDVRPFLKIASYLRGVGLSAPDVIGADVEHGFLLLEDLGDDLFARVVQSDRELEPRLYEAATDVLVHLHNHEPPELPHYGAAVMTEMASLSLEWFAPGLGRPVSESERSEFSELVSSMLIPLDCERQVLVQRDYHSENLIWLPTREDVARVGLLDFQDAMRGHPVYDLVSILQDARRDVDEMTVEQMKKRYATAVSIPIDQLNSAFARLGVQRALRILGVFARLCLRDSKPGYVDLIPRVWSQLQNNLAHPDLADLRDAIQEVLPEPEPAALKKLKRKTAAVA